MLDVSDGLLLDAGRIAEASGAVLDLDPGRLQPFVRAVAAAAPEVAELALELVLSGGEDHGLLACFPSDAVLPAPFTRIGSVSAGEPAVLLGGAVPRVGRAGWDSFA